MPRRCVSTHYNQETRGRRRVPLCSGLFSFSSFGRKCTSVRIVLKFPACFFFHHLGACHGRSSDVRVVRSKREEIIRVSPANFPPQDHLRGEWEQNALVCFSTVGAWRIEPLAVCPTECIQPSTDKSLSSTLFTQLLNNRKTKASGVPQHPNEKCSPYEEQWQKAWEHSDAAKCKACSELSRNLNEYVPYDFFSVPIFRVTCKKPV